MPLITVENMRSSVLERKIAFNVLLPNDSKKCAHPEGEKFKTLYLLHGFRDNKYTWILYTRICELSETYNLAVVMPSGENSWYQDVESSVTNYEKFVGQELLDLTRKTFPLSDKREDTFIGGFSMGGIGCLTSGLKHRENFSKIMCFAPALVLDETYGAETNNNSDDVFGTVKYLESYFGDFQKAKNSDRNVLWTIDQMKKNGEKFPGLFLRTGEDDSLLPCHKKLTEVLSDADIELDAKIVPGAHEWDFINRNLEDGLKFLLDK